MNLNLLILSIKNGILASLMLIEIVNIGKLAILYSKYLDLEISYREYEFLSESNSHILHNLREVERRMKKCALYVGALFPIVVDIAVYFFKK